MESEIINNEKEIEKYIIEEIEEEVKTKKEEQIEEVNIGEFKEIFDPIKSGFEEQEKKDEFFSNDNLNSLVLITDNKNDLIEVKYLF